VLTDQAGFAAATFLGTLHRNPLFAAFADRSARRAIRSAHWSVTSAATTRMAALTRPSACLWRFIAGAVLRAAGHDRQLHLRVGFPKDGAVKPSQSLARYMAFRSRPAVVLLFCQEFHSDIRVGPLAACPLRATAVVWFVRPILPESPRWLLQHVQLAAAEPWCRRI